MSETMQLNVGWPLLVRPPVFDRLPKRRPVMHHRPTRKTRGRHKPATVASIHLHRQEATVTDWKHRLRIAVGLNVAIALFTVACIAFVGQQYSVSLGIGAWLTIAEAPTAQIEWVYQNPCRMSGSCTADFLHNNVKLSGWGAAEWNDATWNNQSLRWDLTVQLYQIFAQGSYLNPISSPCLQLYKSLSGTLDWRTLDRNHADCFTGSFFSG